VDAAVEVFAAAVDPAILAQLGDRASVGAMLASTLASARGAWPALVVPELEFVRHVATRLPLEQPVAAMTQLRAADLYLAFACARGDAGAIAHFESLTFRDVELAGATARATPDLIAETKAHLRSVLFVGSAERPPATAEYAGRGDLRGWVRVSALRHMIRIQARGRRELALDDGSLLEALSPADDPELGYLRELYREAFRDAFRRAVEALDQREKSLLRYQLLDGLSIDAIGVIHGVHRATAARWLVAARDALAEHTRRFLGAALGASVSEIESIIRLVRSRVDVSLERLIDEPPGG
jgi:RNA polymerase sigma-70 factor, ECF subfamily